jgi:hypothetical protein
VLIGSISILPIEKVEPYQRTGGAGPVEYGVDKKLQRDLVYEVDKKLKVTIIQSEASTPISCQWKKSGLPSLVAWANDKRDPH